MPRLPRFPRRGFTLIELLTVIAIIGILAAIIIPVVGRVRQSASKATMTSNLRQLGLAMVTFAADNKDHLPGAYVRGVDAGGINASYVLSGGQTAYANYSGTGTEPRAALQSIDQLGRYITRSTITVDGTTKLYCALLESPAFASQRQAGVFPPSIVLGNTVRSLDGGTVYPFGHGSGHFSMKLSRLGTSFNPSRRWLAIEVDQTTPAHIVGASVSWRSQLPEKPVHGGAWLALMFDGSVSSMRADDPRINNTVN